MTIALRATAATLLVIAAASPAWAADEAELSLNGQTWARTLSGPLFDSDIRWVPGDIETRSFLVRNQGPTAAVLTVTVRSTDTDRLLALDDIALTARAGNGPWVPLHNGRPSVELTRRALAENGNARIAVRAGFRPESANRSQRGKLDLAFVVTLTQALPGDTALGGGTGSGDPGNLPQTGATIESWMTWTAAALIGAGLMLVGRRRTDQDDD